MKHRTAVIAVTSVVALSGRAASDRIQEERTMEAYDAMIAPGTNRDFSFTVMTGNPDGVWALWTDPATWGDWDKGLKSAAMTGQMRPGSTGTITPLSGPQSQFRVVTFDLKKSYAFETRLPLAVLRVARSFNADRTAFTHRVTFSGLMGFAFASMFGPGFRKALPPTMQKLNTLAEAQT